LGRRVAIVIAAAVVAILVGSLTGAATASTGQSRAKLDSGVRGVVRTKERCSVPTGCARIRPSARLVVVATDDDGRRVGQTVVHNGRFSLRLHPGRYTIGLVERRRGVERTLARRRVRIRPHRFTLVVLGPAENTR
jgi:hypothetical protein